MKGLSLAVKPFKATYNHLFGLLFCLVIVLSLFSWSSTTQASQNMVINEVMYHPTSANEDEEFIELYNPGSESVDISGWCIAEGVSICFDDNTTVNPYSYVVISPNISHTQATYSVTAIKQYSGNLSNKGETITLRNEIGMVVDSVTYSDDMPWPLRADGEGRSLELKDAVSDNSLAENWGASLVDSGTPGAENSIVQTLGRPVLSNVQKPTNVNAGDSPIITIMAEDVASVTLKYKVMFDNEQSVQMYDDGNNNDGTVGDNIYGASIPAQAAGKLVRYKIEATNNNGTTVSPGNDDTQNYHGYVVNDSSQSGTTPRLQWFISESDYTDLINTPDGQQPFFDCIIAYGDQVYDNARVRLKGSYSRTFPKKPFKVNLPQGYRLAMPGVLSDPLNEFHLNSDFATNDYIKSIVSWRVFEYAGFPVPQVQKIQLQRNGDFEGVYTLVEKYDNEWLERNLKFKDAIIYEGYFEKEQPQDNDNSDRDEWRAKFNNLEGDEKKSFLLDSMDIPNVINFLAVQAIIRNHDWTGQHNIFLLNDQERTGRWSFMPWDLDLAFSNMGLSPMNQEPGYGYMIDPRDVVVSLNATDRYFANAVWDDPELKSLYLRRVKTLVDEVYKTGKMEQWVQEEFTAARDAIMLDYAKWYDVEDAQYNTYRGYMVMFGLDPDNQQDIYTFMAALFPGVDFSGLPDPITSLAPFTPDNRLYLTKETIKEQIRKFDTVYLNEGLLPQSQTATHVIVNELMYNPVNGQDLEFIELYNPSNEALDISGWKLSGGITMTLPGGSVIPANGYALVVKNDTAFRSYYGAGKLILGEYNGDLSDEGEIITLKNNDVTKISFAYSSQSPWPSTPNGQGPSLSLSKSDANVSRAYCWAPSAENDGTPGRMNVLNQAVVSGNAARCASGIETALNNPLISVLPGNITTSAGSTNLSQVIEDVDNSRPQELQQKSKLLDQPNTSAKDIIKYVFAAVIVGGIGVAGTFVTKSVRLLNKTQV
jgi:hypothetical protein